MTDNFDLAKSICVDPLRQRDSAGLNAIGDALKKWIGAHGAKRLIHGSIPKLSKALEEIYGKKVPVETLDKIAELVVYGESK